MPAIRSVLMATLGAAAILAAGPAASQVRGAYAHACFPANVQAGYLRIEWPQSGRWALYNQPYGSNTRVYIGPESAQWCYSARLAEVMRPCRPGFTQPVQPGC